MFRRLTPFIALLALACSSSEKPAATFQRVDAATFTAELAAPRAADAPKQVIIDVREPELFAAGHIPGAINLPWPGAKTNAPAKLAKTDDIVLVCHGGPMGDELGEILAKDGFTKVRNISGGMNGWTGPVVTGS